MSLGSSVAALTFAEMFPKLRDGYLAPTVLAYVYTAISLDHPGVCQNISLLETPTSDTFQLLQQIWPDHRILQSQLLQIEVQLRLTRLLAVLAVLLLVGSGRIVCVYVIA